MAIAIAVMIVVTIFKRRIMAKIANFSEGNSSDSFDHTGSHGAAPNEHAKMHAIHTVVPTIVLNWAYLT